MPARSRNCEGGGAQRGASALTGRSDSRVSENATARSTIIAATMPRAVLSTVFTKGICNGWKRHHDIGSGAALLFQLAQCGSTPIWIRTNFGAPARQGAASRPLFAIQVEIQAVDPLIDNYQGRETRRSLLNP